MPSTTWTTLPTEIKLAIVDGLDIDDARALANVDQATYSACLPAIFKSVTLNGYDALLRFMENVPRGYCRYIKHLDLRTNPRPEDPFSIVVNTPVATEAVIALLIASPCLEQLTIQMFGSMDKAIIPCFAYFTQLKSLTIQNSAQEDRLPLSERLVVAIAASIPKLQHLSLDRISRSRLHAQELQGVFPSVPLVSGDEDIPDHPWLGSDLYLPSILRIPTLKSLVIKDTHLGDPRWASTPVACRLEVLDIGSCYHADEDFNKACTERIMAAVGRTVDEFSLTTAVSDTIFSEASATPLQRLRKLHISPFFPVDSVVDTMSNLAGSPIEALSMQCYEDDVVDVCAALEDFLSLRIQRGSDFYDKLTRIDVTVTASDDSSSVDLESCAERVAATKRLHEFCRDLRLKSQVRAKVAKMGPLGTHASSFRALSSVRDGRLRAMTF